jgi:predicted phosphodiesterase
MSNDILVIGDIHEPVAHPAYRQFCLDVYKRQHCNQVVFIGDILDWHGISYHVRHPAAPGVKDEYMLAMQQVQKWYSAFPNAHVCIGNHDERPMRLAENMGIPGSMLKNYAEVWNTPSWKWVFDYKLDDVYYFHGTGRSGMFPAFNVMKDMGMSVCMGHVHSVGGIRWAMSPLDRRFGLDTSCGVDDRTYAMAYSKHNKKKSVLGCGTVKNGVGQHHIMQCGRGEEYDRKQFPENPLLG